MKKFRIESKAGVVFGIYEADTPEQAAEALSIDAGYASRAEEADTLGKTVEQLFDDLIITEVSEIESVIDRAGGQSAFARLHGIPLRTVQDWAAGKRQPPDWLVKILDKITK